MQLEKQFWVIGTEEKINLNSDRLFKIKLIKYLDCSGMKYNFPFNILKFRLNLKCNTLL